MKEKQKLLEVRNLRTYFKTDDGLAKAVDDISFTVYKGETVGIVGESGSGKSVTCLTAMRLIPQPPGFVESGQILYHNSDGKVVDLVQISDEEMRQYRGNELAMIFQEPMTSLNPVFTCGEQVVETIMLHQNVSKFQASQRTLTLFEKVKLPDPIRMYNAYPHQLSGGQKQRVMIAMALSCNPSLLIADEPTTALDVTVQKTILELIDGLRKEIETSVIFITHDLGVIAEVADRVVVMYKGKIVEQGTVLEVFESPKHPYTKSLLACRPPLDFRMSKLPIVSDFMEVGKDTAGNNIITEKEKTVQELITQFYVKPETTKARLEDLKTKPNLLDIQNLKVWYPTEKDFLGRVTKYVKAIDDISFTVRQGETVGLVGESGCGKTTTGRAILRLSPATSGKILFENKNILDLEPPQMQELRRHMQIIFQDPYSSLNPRMPVGKAIMEPMTVHNVGANEDERKAKVLDLLKTVSLEERHFNRYPHEFSGGQRQRICIARALALRPRFIICDESVSALDVSVQAQVLNLLIDLRKEFQFTYIFISHDLSVVKFMSDKMVVMNKGKIEEMGIADEIYENPQQEYTKKLISAIPKGRTEDIKSRLNLYL
jgi:peptide/nickel transport system ATP-binding protein